MALGNPRFIGFERDYWKLDPKWWSKREWERHTAMSGRNVSPVAQPTHLAPTWGLNAPKRVGVGARGRAVDQILHDLGLR